MYWQRRMMGEVQASQRFGYKHFESQELKLGRLDVAHRELMAKIEGGFKTLGKLHSSKALRCL